MPYIAHRGNWRPNDAVFTLDIPKTLIAALPILSDGIKHIATAICGREGNLPWRQISNPKNWKRSCLEKVVVTPKTHLAGG